MNECISIWQGYLNWSLAEDFLFWSKILILFLNYTWKGRDKSTGIAFLRCNTDYQQTCQLWRDMKNSLFHTLSKCIDRERLIHKASHDVRTTHLALAQRDLQDIKVSCVRVIMKALKSSFLITNSISPLKIKYYMTRCQGQSRYVSGRS